MSIRPSEDQEGETLFELMWCLFDFVGVVDNSFHGIHVDLHLRKLTI
jgi:hypothetical protein